MSATLTIRDETAAGEPVHEFPLEFPSERITVRELIRERVYQEVTDYNFRSRREVIRVMEWRTLHACHSEPPGKKSSS